ncbi:MAG: 5'-3' exonuclease H3TH domain-containing protein, partial [Bacteroidales bacterium]|nr:5'-3' exonuclease H3TH domain-containing protein [Bacteroidales bacterium]
MSDHRLYLLDAYALIYRSYFAFIKNPRINSKGVNTSAAFGFTLTLEELLRKENPTHIAVAFDTHAPTFRHQMYDAYKANRPPMPEALRVGIPYIRKIIEAFHIPILELDGYEADDVVGTIAKKAEKDGFSVFMMTPDKDYTQLVSGQIKILKPRRSGFDVEILGPEEVCRDFEVEKPEQVIDVLALWGDASDNVPGAPGIGEKSAKDLIHRFGSIQNLYENLDKVKPKQKESLEKNREQVLRARQLVTICTEVPIAFDAENSIRQAPDERALRALFDELEFKNLISKVIPATAEGDLFSPPAAAQPQQWSLFDSLAPTTPTTTTTTTTTTTSDTDILTTDHHYQLITRLPEVEKLAEVLSTVPE